MVRNVQCWPLGIDRGSTPCCSIGWFYCTTLILIIDLFKQNSITSRDNLLQDRLQTANMNAGKCKNDVQRVDATTG